MAEPEKSQTLDDEALGEVAGGVKFTRVGLFAKVAGGFRAKLAPPKSPKRAIGDKSVKIARRKPGRAADDKSVKATLKKADSKVKLW